MSPAAGYPVPHVGGLVIVPVANPSATITVWLGGHGQNGHARQAKGGGLRLLRCKQPVTRANRVYSHHGSSDGTCTNAAWSTSSCARNRCSSSGPPPPRPGRPPRPTPDTPHRAHRPPDRRATADRVSARRGLPTLRLTRPSIWSFELLPVPALVPVGTLPPLTGGDPPDDGGDRDRAGPPRTYRPGPPMTPTGTPCKSDGVHPGRYPAGARGLGPPRAPLRWIGGTALTRRTKSPSETGSSHSAQWAAGVTAAYFEPTSAQ